MASKKEKRVSTSAEIRSGKYYLNVDGLTADKVEASIVYDPDDNSIGRNTGMSAQFVQNGETTFTSPVAFLTGGNQAPGTLTGWARAEGSAFNGDPIGDKETIRVND